MVMNNLNTIQIPVYSHCSYPPRILKELFSNAISEDHSSLVPMELVQKEFKLHISLIVLPIKPQPSYKEIFTKIGNVQESRLMYIAKK